ncbi:divalent metal cation (Fe/Co/Zn/Cd) transporter [Catalinimonas alkaloidigena]|uniref:cation transporter n=1 Tax=Catalinimonas alkaloidigena TaxID=1075417 RepID=UPI002405CE53|nr:cation transporter [Catalinimonas alkaloidigena]MDF9797509.1 divalent metal cation (Fe/Co/Zn/Cd) transporter [Catalinimonas alkaloidigena]
MKTSTIKQETERSKWLQIAFWLSMITIFYNMIEGIVSTYFGMQDETLALFGFGVDSFVEVISGIGIAHMVYRLRSNPNVEKDRFERQALRITGFSFYLLTVGIVASSVLTIIAGGQPETTRVGIIISTISIITMYALVHYKIKAGKKLNSPPIISDANCTKTCLYLSLLLLLSSGLYELFQIPYIDAIGALGIAYFAFKEGREAFEKAKGKDCCGDTC